MPEKVVSLTKEISHLTGTGLKSIHDVTRRTKTIAINAMIEAARIGEKGRGFAVVAEEVGKISEQITEIAVQLETKLKARVGELDAHGHTLIRAIRGTRLIDLSSNMIDIIDRNLYERSCDVRWWATDAAVVDVLQAKNPVEDETRERNRCGDRYASLADHASRRLAVILNAYTVYLDIWVADLSGKVVATGRQNKYREALGRDVSKTEWFQSALKTKSGDDYAVSDIEMNPIFQSTVATYAAAIREGGLADGKIIGVLGIFFDWAKQSQTVIDNVRLGEEEKSQTRCLILDAKGRVIASTGGKGVLTESFSLKTEEKTSGAYTDSCGRVIGFFRTVGYETYAGLGWYGVIVQEVAQSAEASASQHTPTRLRMELDRTEPMPQSQSLNGANGHAAHRLAVRNGEALPDEEVLFGGSAPQPRIDLGKI